MMERNIKLDYFKILLSLLVVSSHMQPLFPSHKMAGWLVSNGIARIAVPIFFIINGYFICSRLDKPKKLLSYVKHLLIIYVTWSIIYSPYWFSLGDLKSTIRNLIFGYFHLWYLPALFVGILFLFALKKIVKKDNLILLIALLSFIVGYFFSKEHHEYLYLYRSGITLAFPFIALGYYIKVKDIENSISDKILLSCIIIGAISLVMEAYYQYVFYRDIYIYQDFLLSPFLICPALFAYVIKHPMMSSGKSFIGSLSSGIYFIHPLVIYTLQIPYEYTIYKYVLVVIIAALLSYIVYLLDKRVKIFF